MKNKTDKNIWDELSDQYGENFLTREYIFLPALLKTLKEIENKKILDLGCGTGYFSEILHRRGAAVTGVDWSSKMLGIAKSRSKTINYLVGDALNLSALYGQKFDYVIMVMVFCCVSDRKKFNTIFKEVGKILKNNGRLIIIDYHPCGFVDLGTPILKHQMPKNFQYFKGPQKFLVTLKNRAGKDLSFFDYSWTLSDYADAIKKTNLIIEDIQEPRLNKLITLGKSNLRYFKNNPVFMMIKCQKR